MGQQSLAEIQAEPERSAGSYEFTEGTAEQHREVTETTKEYCRAQRAGLPVRLRGHLSWALHQQPSYGAHGEVPYCA